jgi:hypothetical protein
MTNYKQRLFFSAGSVIGIVFVLVFGTVVAAVCVRNDRERQELSDVMDEYDKARQMFSGLDESSDIKEAMGSDIGIHRQFLSMPDGLAILYELMRRDDIPDDAKQSLEVASYLFKIPIVKTTIAREPRAMNTGWKIYKIIDDVEFVENNTALRQRLQIDAEYRVREDKESPIKGEMSGEKGPLFCAYLELGMTPPTGKELNINAVVKTKNEEYNIICPAKPVGSSEDVSLLYEVQCRLKKMKDGERISIGISTARIAQEAMVSGKRIEFSIYDFHIERFAGIVEELVGRITFDKPIYARQVCISPYKESSRDCRKGKMTRLEGLEENKKTNSIEFRSYKPDPKRPVVILFTKYPAGVFSKYEEVE